MSPNCNRGPAPRRGASAGRFASSPAALRWEIRPFPGGTGPLRVRPASPAVRRIRKGAQVTADRLGRLDPGGIARQTVGRGRGQAAPLTADGLAAIIATADRPRRRGRGWETDQVATDRGAIDKAIAGLLFQGGLRRSEAAALQWGDVQRQGAGLTVQVRTSKTNQTGDRADVRYLKNGAAAAVLALRGPAPADDALVLGGLNAESAGAASPKRPRLPASQSG